MQVDSDNGYMGDYNYNYNYDAYYPQFGGDLGMLEMASTKVGKLRATPAPSIENPWVTPARSIKAGIEASFHEAMKYKPTILSNKFSALASLECEELPDDDRPVINPSNRALQPPVACGPARRREPRNAAPLCGKFRDVEGGCVHGCCEARSEPNMHTEKARVMPAADPGMHDLQRRELTICPKRKMQGRHPEVFIKQLPQGGQDS